MAAQLGRRGFLGYVGSAAAGAVVGAGAGAVAGHAAGSGDPASDSTEGAGLGATISPWGEHQAGVTAPAAAVTELVALDLHDDLRRSGDTTRLARLMRVWTTDVEALAQGRGTPGDTAPWLSAERADLAVTVGWGPRVFTDFEVARPEGFARVPAMRHDALEKAWSGGDLLLVVQGRDGTTVGHAVRRLVADAAPFASLRWRQGGSWNPHRPDGSPQTGRNLFGQVDGSANPKPGTDLFDRTVWISSGPWAGGTTVVVRRIRMDLATWDTLTRSEQEGSVGRDLAEGAPLTGGGELDDVDLAAKDGDRFVVNVHAHVRRSHPSTNGGRRMFRKGVNYEAVNGSTVEAGLIFSAYQANLADQFVPVQQMLDEGDELNEWTTAVGSAEFAVLPGFEQGGWLGQSLLDG